jgi:integrase
VAIRQDIMKIFRRPLKTRLGQPVLDAAGAQLLSARYYYRFQHLGKRITKVTPYTDERRARQLAVRRQKELQEGALAGDLPNARAHRTPAGAKTSLQVLLDTYERLPLDAAEATRRRNSTQFVRLLMVGTGQSEATCRQLTLDQLTPDILARFYACRQAVVAAADSQGAAASSQRTTNSTLRQAISIFSPRVLDSLREAGLVDLPDFSAFRGAAAAKRFHRIPRKEWSPPSEECLAATLAAWLTVTDRNLFLAVGLCLSCGLRAGEAAQARWSWFTQRNGAPFVDAVGRFKSGTGTLQLTPLDPWYATLHQTARARGWIGDPTDYVLSGTDPYRQVLVWREVSEWLSRLGWTTQKKAHALRAYAGSMVAMKYGIYEASRWLRHSSVTVTESHYLYFLGRQQGLDPARYPIQWATVPTAAFTPQIIAA